MTTEEIKQHLKKFYDELYTDLLVDKKLKRNSVLISFFEMKSNDRYRFLEGAAVESFNLPETMLFSLISEGLLRESDELHKYTITAKGIWVVERDSKINECELIDYIDEKLFKISLSNKKLTDKERIILLAMICGRTFTINSPIDLKKDNYTLDGWKRIIDDCSKLLFDLKIINKMSQEQLYGKKGNEHIVSHLIRHTDSLPKKTKGIYKAPGQQKYFLDIASDNVISKDKLTYILSLIFSSDGVFEIESIYKVRDFCLNIAYQEASLIFEMKDHIFAAPEYDDILNEAIQQVAFS